MFRSQLMMSSIRILAACYLLTYCHAVVVNCDIVIGGGNTGALSAAISVAELAEAANKSISVCLLEPTDWLGGQMTAQGVSAVDYGIHNRYSINWPPSWTTVVETLKPNGKNQGNCWVSPLCYQPATLINKYISPVLQQYAQYITVYNRTVIINTSNKTDSNGNQYIDSVTAIQRKPVNSSQEWSYLLSQQLEDWYSPQNSTLFTKTYYTFTASIFIEATEFGDIMMTSGIEIYQGVETPTETSTTTLDQCGQASTMVFFMELLADIPENPAIIPAGNPEGLPYDYGTNSWTSVWTYRRSYDAQNHAAKVGNLSNHPNITDVNYGDITQQNFGSGGNDYDNGYIFLPVNVAKNGTWKGGVNITALKEAEQRAYGFYHYFVNTSNQSTKVFDPRQLVMNFNISNTSIGLSKFPYLRDGKRSAGLFGFKLNHTTFLPRWNETSKTGHYKVGYKFADRVAIGNFPFDMHLLTECMDQYPKYVKGGQTTNVPYFIPFRAIGNNVYRNLLFAGKNIAQSFYANAATRLHPVEWNTGIAAGTTAFYMVDTHVNDTRTVYNQIDELQALLKFIGQPLEWN